MKKCTECFPCKSKESIGDLVCCKNGIKTANSMKIILVAIPISILMHLHKLWKA